MQQNRKRRSLPGPLAHLPKAQNDACKARKLKSAAPNYSPTDDFLNNTQTEMSICDESNTELWDRAVAHCGLEAWPIIAEYTIENIIKNAETGFPRGKVPVLCAVLDKVERLKPDAKAVLRDKTGCIGCSIDRSVLQRYKKFLCPGGVLLLKQVSLFSLNWKTFYLNITHSNVVRIFLDDQQSSFSADLIQSASKNLLISSTHSPKSHCPQSTPFSVKQLKDLIADCMKPPSPIPSSPAVPISNHRDQFSSPPLPAFSGNSQEKTPSRHIGGLKATVSRVGAASPSAFKSPVPSGIPRPQLNSHSASPSTGENCWRLGTSQNPIRTPSRVHPAPRSGFGALLGNVATSNAETPLTVPASPTVSVDGVSESTKVVSQSHSQIKSGEIPPEVSRPTDPLNLMEDDMDDLLVSVLE